MTKKNMYLCALALMVPMCAVAGDKPAETSNLAAAHARSGSSSIISGKNPNSFFYGRDRSGSKGSSSSDEEEKHSGSGSPVKTDTTRTRANSHIPPLSLKKSSRTPSPARFGQPMSADFETAEEAFLKLSPRSQLALMQAVVSNLRLQDLDSEQVDIFKEKVAKLDPFAASATTGKSSPTKDTDLPPLHNKPMIHTDKKANASAQTSITISRRPEAVAKPGYVNYKAGQNPLKETATGAGSDSSSSDSRRSSPKSDGAGSDADSSSSENESSHKRKEDTRS